MKTTIRILILALVAAGLAATAVGGDKDHKGKAAPKGGRLLDKTEPCAELVVEKDRTVTINFYNKEMKPVAATTQNVTVLANAKDGKASLEFEKKGDALVTKTKLPEGEGYNVVVQFKQSAEAKPQNFRFVLDLHNCGGCKRAEYACTCDH